MLVLGFLLDDPWLLGEGKHCQVRWRRFLFKLYMYIYTLICVYNRHFQIYS